MNNSKIFTAQRQEPENVQLFVILGIGVIIFTFLSYLLPLARSRTEANGNNLPKVEKSN